MPLLSNKLYILNRIKKDKKDEDSSFCHSLTNEICENQEEFNRKSFLYNQKIWTCRITGQINLTFKEALKSEQGCSKMLKNSFKKCFEATVLQFVHHSKESLDTLIHKAWTQIHQEFCVNEPVTIKLTTPKEMILKGIVVKVDRSRSNEDQENSPIKLNSDASSSDKENMKKKIIPVKKNYFYSVKIFEMEKLVKDIPSETIERTLRPPSKDQIRMFIRAHAIRHSGKQNNPWVVDEELIKKYRLPNLEPEFAVDKQKMKELSKLTEIQMYNKMKDEHKDTTVDLTRSDDEENSLSIKHKSLVNNNHEAKDKSIKNKKLKQTTLFDGPLSSTGVPNGTASGQRNSSVSSTIRSPLSSPTRSLPPLAQRVLKLMKDNPADPNVKQLIFKCGQLFSNQQIAKFPDLIRVPIADRKEKYEEKKRLDAMTAEQREAYLSEKRNQMRRQMREKKREENAKLEDNELEYAKEIPEGIPIAVEGGMSQDQWARLVSVCEFVRCYKRLLMPSGEATDDSNMLTARDLCQSVISDCDSAHEMLADFVCVLLKPLLQDSRIRSRKEMGLALTELPVTSCTAGELLRLVLLLGPTLDNDGNEDGNDETKEQHGDVGDEEVSTEIWNCNHNKRIAGPICEKLQTVELQQLSIDDKIGVLELLQSRILELDIVSSFIDDYQREVCEAYKKRIADTKEFNDKLKIVRQSKQDMCKLLVCKLGTCTDDINNKSIVSDTINSGLTIAAHDSLPIDDMSQVVRRRQSIEMKLKESEERERKLEKERQYQKLEKEEIQYKKLLEQSQKSYFTAMNEAKQLMRVQPLGSDRHFRRYWHFSSAPGAVYVEIEQTNTGAVNIGTNSAFSDHVTTEWNMFTTHEQLQQLLNCLSDKGIRESLLKSELESALPKLTEEFQSVSKPKEELTGHAANPSASGDSCEQSFLVAGFKRELKETEISIRQGSLGGVENYPEWQKRVESSVTLNEMKETLVLVFLGVHERFWNVPLKSANGRNEFLNSVEQAQTQARLNMLQSFLDACVCWSKSAKDDKCRVCRKASDENSMLLCDSCNHAFHTFCLRPALHDVPEGEWFCPHCKPVSRARDAESDTVPVTASITQLSGKSIKTRQQTSSSHSEQCFVCHSSNSDQQLAKCTSCNKLFHAHCHEPPLRQIRRTNWHCCQCRLDEASNKISNKPSRRSISTVDINNDSDGNDDQNSSSNEDLDKSSKKRNKTNKKRNNKNGLLKKKPFTEVEKEDEEEISEGESQKSSAKPPLRKKSRIMKTTAEESKPKKEPIDNNSDSDESDQDVDNLPYLFTKRSTNRKRSSVTSSVKLEQQEPSNNDSDDDEVLPTPKKSCNGISVVKIESLQPGKRSTNRKRSSIATAKADESEDCNESSESANNTSNHKAPVTAKKSCNGISAEKIEKACYHMLKNMINHKASWPFVDPVDPEEVPDYYQIITDPINLAQMMDKYKQRMYASGIDSLRSFLSDVGLMFFNAEVYNEPDSDIMNLAVTLEQFFKGIYSKYEFGVEYTRRADTTD